MVGVCETCPDLDSSSSSSSIPEILPYFSKGGRCVDTVTSEDGDVVVKTNANDIYPEQVKWGIFCYFL